MKAIVLTAVLGFFAMGTPCPAADLETLIPADANVAIVVEVGRILNSPILKAHGPEIIGKFAYKAMLDSEDDADDKKEIEENAESIKSILEDHDDIREIFGALAETVSRVVVAGSMQTSKPEFIAVEGKWDRDYAESMMTLLPLFSPENVSLVKEKGRKIFSTAGDDEDPEMYFAFPDDDIVVLAYSTEAIHAIFDRAEAKKSVVSESLNDFLKNPGADDVARVFVDQVDQKIKMTGSIKLKSDAEAEVAIDTGEEAKAVAVEKDFSGKIDAFREGLEKQADGNPLIKIAVNVVKGLSTEREGGVLKYRAKVASREIDELLKAIEEAAK